MPSSSMVSEVSVQLGEVCGGDVLGLHNLTVATFHSAPVTLSAGTSLVSGVMV